MERDKNEFIIAEKISGAIKRFWKQNYIPFTAALAVGILTYMFALTNKLLNHDDLKYLFDKGATLTSGRWGLNFLSYIFPDVSMPWIYGLISLVLFAISICVIINIFRIKSKLLQVLLSALIISFPSLIGTFSYMFTVSSYGVSFLCIVLSVQFITDNSLCKKIIAVPLLIFALSVYQAYISVVAVLLLVFALQRLIKENSNTLQIFRQGVMFVAFMLVCLIIYYAITQLILFVTDVKFNDYTTENLNLKIGIFERIKSAYIDFFRYFKGHYGLIPTKFSQLVHGVGIVILGIMLLLIWFKKKISEKLLIVLLGILFPLAVNCMFLVTNSGAIHTLVLYGFVGIYVLAAVILDYSFESSDGKALKFCTLARETVAVIMIFVAIINIYVGNQAFLRLLIQQENAQAFYTGVMTRVQMTPGFDGDSKIALIGKQYNGIYIFNEFEDVSRITGVNRYLINVYSREDFIRYYMGYDLPFATDAEISKIKKTEEYANMPDYPYYGAVTKIGDYIVVKFGL